MSISYHLRPNNVSLAGFGLVELLVSISIVILVSSIVLVRHSSFNGAALLRGQAYQVALTTRDTQLLAISATENTSGGDFRGVYGLHFDTGNDGEYIIFKDADGDYFYDSSERFGKAGVLDKRFEISAIRLVGGGSPGAVSVTFERPNFDAIIHTSSGPAGTGVSAVEIDVRVRGTTGATTGEVRTVEITRTGQITVQ